MRAVGQGLNPLLPHIAGVMENMNEATLAEITREIETDMYKKVSRTDLTKALESGIRLGLFVVKREFRVCKEFTTKQLKKVKLGTNFLMSAEGVDFPGSQFAGRRKKSLLAYVKRQREERQKRLMKKLISRRAVLSDDFRGGGELCKFLCDQCRESLEREERPKRSGDPDGEGPSHVYVEPSGTSLPSNRSLEGKGEEKPEKSRLLVQKNPMETEPPYCDIFT